VRPHDGWALWRVTQGTGELPYLLLPPTDAEFLSGLPIEEVAMVRDEAANLAWALHTIPAGAAPVLATPASGAGDLIYVPITPLPDARVPLVLGESAAGRFLTAGHMVNQSAAAPTALIPANFRLRDEELPDEGLILRRRFKLGRTPDGVLRLWIARSKDPGARLPTSGLDFDRLNAGDAKVGAG
jgi:hypothetical protein